MKRAQLEQRQRAQVIVIFPLAVLMLLGMAAMAIDGGRLFLGRQELQKAAEAAALDGAWAGQTDPASNDAAVQLAVNASVARNLGVADTICQPGSVHVDAPKYQGETMVGGTTVNGVYVRISCTALLTAAAVIPGVAGTSLGGDAEAVLGSADPTTGKFVPYQPYPPLNPYPRVLPPPST